MAKKIKVIEIPDFKTIEEVLKYCEDLFTNEDAKIGFLAWKKFKHNQNKIPIRILRDISIEILKKA